MPESWIDLINEYARKVSDGEEVDKEELICRCDPEHRKYLRWLIGRSEKPTFIELAIEYGKALKALRDGKKPNKGPFIARCPVEERDLLKLSMTSIDEAIRLKNTTKKLAARLAEEIDLKGIVNDADEFVDGLGKIFSGKV